MSGIFEHHKGGMETSRHLITPPSEDVVTLAEAKAQLRITDASQDDFIAAILAAAVNQIDPAGGGLLGRALRPQTWELRLDRFPFYYCGSGFHRNFRSSREIELPYPPLLSVDSVTYDDGSGVQQTLVQDVDYSVLGLGTTAKARIAPVYAGTWPSSVRFYPESVRIRFTCGYDDLSANSPPGIDTLPAPIKQAVLLGVKHLYSLGERNLFVSSETVDGLGARQFVVTQNAALVMKTASDMLLSSYQVFD